MHCTIEKYAPDHQLSLRELYLAARQQAFTWLDSQRFSLADFDVAVQGEQVLAAVCAGRPVGFIAWWPPDNFIHSLFVAPQHQGQGIGKSLLTAGLAQMGRPATLKCLQQNQPALDFYRTQGWQRRAVGKSPEGPYFLLALQ